MKQLFTLAALLFLFSAKAQKLEKVWETDTIVAVPESVLPDAGTKVLYVSLIDGAAWEADGKGGIGRLSFDGKQYDPTWVTGLNAPKGLGLYQNRLFVADISEVVVIDVKKGAVEKRISIQGASALNDVTVSEKGIVYVSDSKTARIWRLENDEPTLYLENMQGVNGLKAVGDALLIASGKTFLKAGPDKSLTKIAELPQGGDGVEPLQNGDYLVSAWVGSVFYVSASGTVKTLLDLQPEKKNTADIGYDPTTRMVYVPTFLGKTVAAYRLDD